MTTPICHPEQEHHAKGLCKSCYHSRHHKIKADVERQQAREWKNNNREKVKRTHLKYRKTTKGRFNTLQQKAKARQLECSLTFEEFSTATLPECFYCNGFFGRVQQGIGLDRLDNSEGYVLGNVVSCCKFCNLLRNNFLSVEETKTVVQVIISMRTRASEAA